MCANREASSMLQKHRSERKISGILMEVTTYGWLCTEIGQFVQHHIHWGQSELFWPFWICLSLAIIMATKLLDVYVSNRYK